MATMQISMETAKEKLLKISAAMKNSPESDTYGDTIKMRVNLLWRDSVNSPNLLAKEYLRVSLAEYVISQILDWDRLPASKFLNLRDKLVILFSRLQTVNLRGGNNKPTIDQFEVNDIAHNLSAALELPIGWK